MSILLKDLVKALSKLNQDTRVTYIDSDDEDQVIATNIDNLFLFVDPFDNSLVQSSPTQEGVTLHKGFIKLSDFAGIKKSDPIDTSPAPEDATDGG